MEDNSCRSLRGIVEAGVISLSNTARLFFFFFNTASIFTWGGGVGGDWGFG